MRRLGILVADRYRTIPEAVVVEILLLAGWAFEMSAGLRTDATAQTRAALEKWIDLGLGVCRRDGARYFDPVEVVNFLIWAGRAGLDDFWADRYVQTGRALVRSGGAPVQRFTVRLRRRFNLGACAPGAPVRLRLPVPLVGTYLRELDMTLVVAPSLAAHVAFSPGRMEARLAVPQNPFVEIGADVAFTTDRTAAEHLEPAEAELYLRPSEGPIQVSPRIQALAAALAGPDPWATLRAFWTYMLDELSCGAVHYDQLTTACDWVLDHKWYDCQLGSALLVSLCRARGIPARIVGGHVLYRLAPTNHFWAEAWIDGEGWMPFDLLSWGLSRGGQDPAWREHFFGNIDARMVTQVLPLAFTGPMSVRLPPSWHIVQTAVPGGIRIAFLTLAGALIYEDMIALT